jgi:hypothetical protein
MGSKVPWDLCSICTDWGLYHEALETYDTKKHKHPGISVLEFHKKLKEKNGKGIRGLSITRNDYCIDMRSMPNRILSDGRKVFVYNDFPRFFDISFVFIGADKTAKVMLFISRGGEVYSTKPSAQIADELGVTEETSGLEKAASVADDTLKLAFLGKLAKNKQSEIDKAVPSQFVSDAVPLLTDKEPDLDKGLIDRLSALPMSNVLSTTAGMGMVLKPREFQRITLIQLGNRPLADELDCCGKVMPQCAEEEPMEMGSKYFLPALAKMLLPLMAIRSALGPVIEKRVVMAQSGANDKNIPLSSHSTELLNKIGSAYNGYRRGVMQLVANSQQMLASAGATGDLHKLAEASVHDLFTPLSVAYLQQAYLNDWPFGDTANDVVKSNYKQASAGVERVLPSVNTWRTQQLNNLEK